MKSKIYDIVRIGVAVALLTSGVAYATGTWSEPTAAFPSGNVDAPINVGATNQVKSGSIGAAAFSTLNTSIDKAGDGLVKATRLQITGGSAADGRVLTATATSGTSHWESPEVGLKICYCIQCNEGDHHSTTGFNCSSNGGDTGWSDASDATGEGCRMKAKIISSAATCTW